MRAFVPILDNIMEMLHIFLFPEEQLKYFENSFEADKANASLHSVQASHDSFEIRRAMLKQACIASTCLLTKLNTS